MSLMYEIINVNNKLKKEFESRISKFGLSYPKWIILKTIKMNDNSIKAQDIANTINMDKSTTSELIRRLEKEELINRVQDKNDKRCFIVSLTNKTLSICNEAYLVEQEFNKELVSKIPKEDIETFKRVLNKFSV